jgi:glycosyltransferase involved in cell wall biosynthesis
LKITLVSSGQPSANPRLTKEAIAFDQAGYDVTVIYVPISPWADDFDKILFQKYPRIKFIQAGYHPNKQKWLYRGARVRKKVYSLLNQNIGNAFNVVDYSTVLFGQELLTAAKQHKADLYIAHNLGALPAAVKAAQFHNAKVGFDAEDFHRGEFVTDNPEQQKTISIENKYFPLINYLSVASPLIGEAYQKIFPTLSPVTINNIFPLNKLSDKPVKESFSGLSLFWFSQTIGKSRGLENIIRAMGLLKDLQLCLNLLGNVTEGMKNYILEVAYDVEVAQKQINFLAPVPEDELFRLSSGFDIGIGSDVPYCLNREYCLTNKIFTYLIAGNALVLSDTEAQAVFLEEHKEIGRIYKHDNPESLASVLRFYSVNNDILASHQRNARELAEKKLNWETESKKLLALIESVLKI